LVKFGKIFFFPQTSKVKLQKIPEIQYCENPSGCSNHQDRLYYICPPPQDWGAAGAGCFLLLEAGATLKNYTLNTLKSSSLSII